MTAFLLIMGILFAAGFGAVCVLIYLFATGKLKL